MRYDEKTSMLQKVALNIQTINTDTTTAGAIIDTYGYGACTFIIQAGTVSAGDITPLIQEGDDSGLSDAANVSDDFLIGTEVLAKVDASNEITKIGYVGKKRYVRLSAVSATSCNMLVGAICVLGKALEIPTA